MYRIRSVGDMIRSKRHGSLLQKDTKEMKGNGSSFLSPLVIHEVDTTGNGTLLSPFVIVEDRLPAIIVDDDVSEVLVIKDHDENFAEDLEIQELLLSSMKPCAGVSSMASSSSAGREQQADKFYCNICMEPKPSAESFHVPSCPHVFCASCMALYIAAKVEENVTSIGCPDPACAAGAVDPDACRGILPEDVFHRWGWALCEQAVGARRFYCPHKDCSALLIDEPSQGEVITDAECPHCHRMFCARCKVPWHDGIDCEGFQKLSEDERGAEDLMLRKLAMSSKWQRCPQCKVFVERIDGCLFIQCRCGHCFCYVCASPMTIRSHYCQLCKRTY